GAAPAGAGSSRRPSGGDTPRARRSQAPALRRPERRGRLPRVRILGLDVGSRRIGVAVTDELLVAAHPVTVLDRRGTARDVEQIRAVASRYETERLVVGLPFEPDGSLGHRAARVRVLVDALRAAGFAV